MKLKNLVVAGGMLSFPLAVSGANAETWDMALAYSSSNYHSQIAAEFAAEVSAGTDIELVAHPGGSLFPGDQIYTSVRRGIIPIGERLISALANEDPIYGVDSVPFLATGFDASMKLYQASKPELEKTLEGAGLHFLYSCPWPPQGFYSSVEAKTPDDIKGLKFRAYNATTSAFAEELGMVPTKIEAAELPQAFATGVAESMISSGSTGYDQKLWEHVKYYYDVKAWLPRNMVVVNAKAWGGLDDATKAVFDKAAATAEGKCWAKAEELDAWYIDEFKKNGMQVAEMSPELRAAFEKVGAKLRAEWLERAGAKGQAVLDAYSAQ
ncbi:MULTISPECIES: TRAP transporter substrate-binding protein [Thalassospira]|uniref:C4-dicarboxylate ABC transporter substrate-binding protein n=2 Tax=Thalassospira TaxID=168934 RepID=A0A367W9T4_9PROT|nr:MULTISPECIES: TRAP transporter substrate-binding protein [Thalassospira]MDG4719755.1 TRAP transporter substrate-binding protein [Thalassospira sp. FZY0004]RCK38205.1 C4-dicarboxylate ABC transporter substrate-binding protein [Thalassospira profundimaris]